MKTRVRSVVLLAAAGLLGFAALLHSTRSERPVRETPTDPVVRQAASGPVRSPSGIRVAPRHLDFGGVAVGSRAERHFIVTNDGDQAAAVESVDVTPPYEVTGGEGFSLGPGESRSLRVRFTASERGAPTHGSVTLNPRAAGAAPLQVELRAHDRRGPDVRLSSPSITFGVTAAGTSLTSVVAIDNVGDEALELHNIATTGSFRAHRSESRIEPGERLELELTFAPRSDGRHRTALLIDTNDPRRRRVAAVLKGEGASRSDAPRIDVAPAGLDFGATPLGAESSRTVTVRNTGEAALQLSSLICPPPFAIRGRARRIPPGGALDLPIGFAPTHTGAVEAVLRIYSDAADSASVSIALRGRGTPEGVAPSSLADADASAPPVPPRAGEPSGAAEIAMRAVHPSFVAVGSYKSVIDAGHLGEVSYRPDTRTLHFADFQLPAVELLFGERFTFSAVEISGRIDSFGDVDLSMPLRGRRQMGPAFEADLRLTTAAAWDFSALGDQLTLVGAPLSDDRSVTLVGLHLIESAQGLPLRVELTLAPRSEPEGPRTRTGSPNTISP